MSKQIAVRLPDELVEFLDKTVARGQANSRAAAVAKAIDWERRREIAERDAAILAGVAGDPADEDMDQLAEFAARTAMDDLD